MNEFTKIFAKTIEDEAIKQIETLSNSEAYNSCKIRIMPDCHAGKGCTIGTVIELDNRVVPNTVGVDIGCGMKVVRLGKVDIDLQKFDEAVNKLIPSGFNVNEGEVSAYINGLVDGYTVVGQMMGTLIDQQDVSTNLSSDHKRITMRTHDWLLPKNGAVVVHCKD